MHIETFRSKIRTWLGKQFRKFKTVLKKDVDSKVENDENSLKEGLKRYFENILAELVEAEKDNFEEKEAG